MCETVSIILNLLNLDLSSRESQLSFLFCKSENITMSLSQCLTSVCEFRLGKVIICFNVIIGHLMCVMTDNPPVTLNTHGEE